MSSIRIKICGVTTPADARHAADTGADAVGLNFYPKSPRYLAPAAAAPLVRALPPFTAPVGVFVGTPMRQACAVGQMGGTGHVAPWHLLAGFDVGVPLVLAGGLTPENVADAIAAVRPWGVDVASGVESAPGVKDRDKVERFIRAARESR
jgi:phosphoribosylanthranilate isomerase